MNEIADLLSRLVDLNADEITHLLGLISEQYERVDDESKDNPAAAIAEMQSLVEAKEQVKAEQTRRAEEAQAAQQAAEELRARMAATDAEPDETNAPDEGDEGDEGDDDDEKAKAAKAAADAKPAPSNEPEAVAAAGRVARMAAVGGSKPQRSPEARGAPTGRASLIAAAGIRSPIPAGTPLDRQSLSIHMKEALERNVPPRGGRTADILVAAATWEYPEQFRLGDDPQRNSEIMGQAMGKPGTLDSLVAAGGICTPVNVDYSVDTWSGTDRPLRDGLPAFQASRGGLTFVPPPLMSALAGATSLWSEATDANPAGATKPVLVVNCGTPQTVFVDAVPTRLQFGNMQSRFAPEQLAANTDLALAAGARIAELNLQTKIDAASTVVTTTQFVGAGRDVLTTLDVAQAAYRYRHRIPRSQQLTAIFPDWAKDLLRADIVRELAHDTSGLDPRAVTDAQITQWVGARGVSIIWTLDGRAANALGALTNPFQGFGAQAAGALDRWPNNGTAVELDWNLFVQGTFQFLDGGRLDLGVVRDATLDATNDYETFTESFEGIAFRGNESYAVRSLLLPNGASVGSVAATGYVVGT